MQAATGVPPPIPGLLLHPAGPVRSEERVVTLDVLRGFALFGILTVNMALFSWPMYTMLLGAPQWSAMDSATDQVVRALAEGKFYPLFALLFGVGVAIQIERARVRGGNFTGFYCRRLLVLLTIGLVHTFGIWQGDILVMYAVFGFVLIAFGESRPRTLLIWAAICMVLPIVIYAGLWCLLLAASWIPEVGSIVERELAAATANYAVLEEKDLQAFSQGSLGEIFVQRAKNVFFQYQYAWLFVPTFFCMFLLGMYAQRRRILQDVETSAPFLRRVLVIGLAVGLPVNILYSVLYGIADPMGTDLSWLFAVSCLAIGGPILALGYAASITLLLRRSLWRRVAKPFAAAGRMALSNYLFQSLVCTTLFYSYGFGLYGSVGRAAGIGIAIAVFLVQLPLSVWWLNRFRYGPVEWLWRSLSYRSVQPMKL